MSLGLLWRSWIAWVTCVIAIFIGLILQFKLADSAAHWFRIGFDGFLLLMLISAYHRFDRNSITLGSFFALASLVIYLGYAVFGTYHLGDQFSPPITDLTTALYFVVVTITSVGYGDISPGTMEARVFLISAIILGIA
ncbi:voltage-gated potassium channel, partial [methanotrophic bacterial endosymbiont of Bathymodiolus sp.]